MGIQLASWVTLTQLILHLYLFSSSLPNTKITERCAYCPALDNKVSIYIFKNMEKHEGEFKNRLPHPLFSLLFLFSMLTFYGMTFMLFRHFFSFVIIFIFVNISLVQFSCSVMYNSLQPHGLQHARPPCPSPAPGACSNSCPLSCDDIQPFHPLLSSSLSAFNLSQHQGLFQ